jgi:hypothetical protein
MAYMPNAWQTLYNVDFTVLSTQNIKTGGNGTKTIDGKSWTWANDANATTATLTNGTGIACNPVANSGSAAPASRLGPILTIPVTSLMPLTLNVARHAVRVCARVLVTGHTKVAQGIRLGLEDASTPTSHAFSVFKGWAASAPGAPGAGEEEIVIQSSIPGPASSLTLGLTANFSEDVLCWDFIAPDAWDVRTGTYSGGMPYSFSDYRTSEVAAIATPLLRLPAQPALVLAWQDSAAAGGGGFTGTVTHLRLDYLERFPV